MTKEKDSYEIYIHNGLYNKVKYLQAGPIEELLRQTRDCIGKLTYKLQSLERTLHDEYSWGDFHASEIIAKANKTIISIDRFLEGSK